MFLGSQPMGKDWRPGGFDDRDVPRNGTPIHFKFSPTRTENGTEWKVDWFRVDGYKKANGTPVHLKFSPTRTENGTEWKVDWVCTDGYTKANGTEWKVDWFRVDGYKHSHGAMLDK